MAKEQITLIENFLKKPANNLILNSQNEGINELYYFILKIISENNGLKLTQNENVIDTDLFGNKELSIYLNNKSLNIKKLLDNKNPKILFLDYKKFKTHKGSGIAINTYNYRDDIEYFLMKYSGITDKTFINFCALYPEYIYSESLKFEVNKNKYSFPKVTANETNILLKIRLQINQHKKNGDIKKLYNKIKEEVFEKKFSFLIY